MQAAGGAAAIRSSSDRPRTPSAHPVMCASRPASSADSLRPLLGVLLSSSSSVQVGSSAAASGIVAHALRPLWPPLLLCVELLSSSVAHSSVTSGSAGVSSCSAIVSQAPQHVAHAETDPAASAAGSSGGGASSSP